MRLCIFTITFISFLVCVLLACHSYIPFHFQWFFFLYIHIYIKSYNWTHCEAQSWSPQLENNLPIHYELLSSGEVCIPSCLWPSVSDFTLATCYHNFSKCGESGADGESLFSYCCQPVIIVHVRYLQTCQLSLVFYHIISNFQKDAASSWGEPEWVANAHV